VGSPLSSEGGSRDRRLSIPPDRRVSAGKSTNPAPSTITILPVPPVHAVDSPSASRELRHPGPREPTTPTTRILPLLFLILFAAIFPEVLSGSTPPLVLLTHPLGFLLLVAEYGGGAVLVWEALARWRKGWLAVLPLGAAYGIAEEGLATKTFTDPHQQFVITQIPGSYGSWGGVEWVSLTGIDPFHAAVSIGLGLLLLALIYPEHKGRSIVSNRALALIGTAFVADVTLQFFTVDPEPILSLWPALTFIGILGIVLIVAGWRLPRDFLSSLMRSPVPTSRPRAFFAVAFGWLLSLLAVYTLGSHIVPWAGVLIVFFLASGAASLYFVLTRSGWRENRAHQVAFVGGFAGAFLVWDVLLELLGHVGVLAFSAIFVALVIWLWRSARGSLAPPDGGRSRVNNPGPS